jgi:hypothetical protein
MDLEFKKIVKVRDKRLKYGESRKRVLDSYGNFTFFKCLEINGCNVKIPTMGKKKQIPSKEHSHMFNLKKEHIKYFIDYCFDSDLIWIKPSQRKSTNIWRCLMFFKSKDAKNRAINHFKGLKHEDN